jgi:hypothetical protein
MHSALSFNIPAAGKAGIALQSAIGHHCPGLPDPSRWGKIQFYDISGVH